MTLWITDQAVLGNHGEQPARWFIQTTIDNNIRRLWSDDLEEITLWRDVWIKNGNHNVEVNDTKKVDNS